MNPDTATPAAGITASVIIPKSKVTRPDDPSQYIRTYAKDVAYVSGKNPMPPSAATASNAEPQKTRVDFFPPSRTTPPSKPVATVYAQVADADMSVKNGISTLNEPVKQEVFSTSKDDEDIFAAKPAAPVRIAQPTPAPVVVKPQPAYVPPPAVFTPEPIQITKSPDTQTILERLRARAMGQRGEQTSASVEPAGTLITQPVRKEINLLKTQADLTSRVYTPELSAPRAITPPAPRPIPPPVVKPHVAPMPKLVTATAPIPTPAPTPMAVPIPPAPTPPPFFEPAPRPAQHFPIPEPVAVIPESSSPLHTYSSDFADHIDERKATTFSVLAAQQDNAQRTPIPQSAGGSRSALKIAVAAVLVTVGIGLVGGSLYLFLPKQVSMFVALQAPSLIPYDESVEIKGTGEDLQQHLADKADGTLLQGNILLTYVSESTTTQQGSYGIPQPGGVLISRLGLSAPDIFMRNIDPASSVGIIRAGEQTAPFFVFRVNSYERTFAGMLAWEPTMLNDLGQFYRPYPANASSTVATSTPGFVDVVISNHNVRAYKDSLGRTILLYGYIDKQTLILARDAAAFTALAARIPSIGSR